MLLLLLYSMGRALSTPLPAPYICAIIAQVYDYDKRGAIFSSLLVYRCKQQNDAEMAGHSSQSFSYRPSAEQTDGATR